MKVKRSPCGMVRSTHANNSNCYHISDSPLATMVTFLLDLQDELLLNMMMRLSTAAVRNMALTCQCLQCIAQEELVLTMASITKHMWQLVDLLQKRLQLGRLLSHLCLERSSPQAMCDSQPLERISRGQTHQGLVTDVNTKESAVDRSALTHQRSAACWDTIRATNPSLQNWNWMFTARTEHDFLSVSTEPKSAAQHTNLRYSLSLVTAWKRDPSCWIRWRRTSRMKS